MNLTLPIATCGIWGIAVYENVAAYGNAVGLLVGVIGASMIGAAAFHRQIRDLRKRLNHVALPLQQ